MEDKKIGVGVGVVLVDKEGRILLGKRNGDASKAGSELRGEGTWTMPGGKLHYGESFEDCAKREVLEETGIKLNDVRIIAINNDKNEFAHFVTIGAYADGFEGEAKVMEPDEITEWKWFAMEDLPFPIFMPSAKVLWNYRKTKFYMKDLN
jgi:8-oxo-dGTP diphosphatase